jgi:hypothetical protein
MQLPRQKEQAQLPEFQQRSRLRASHLRPDWGALPSKGHDSVVDSFGVLKKHKSLARTRDWQVTCILMYVMETESYLKAVRVEGEVLVLRCWACGTGHCMNAEQCAPEELAHLICSNSNCGMSMFLVNELTADEQSKRQIRTTEPSSVFAALSWFRI